MCAEGSPKPHKMDYRKMAFIVTLGLLLVSLVLLWAHFIKHNVTEALDNMSQRYIWVFKLIIAINGHPRVPFAHLLYYIILLYLFNII